MRYGSFQIEVTVTIYILNIRRLTVKTCFNKLLNCGILINENGLTNYAKNSKTVYDERNVKVTRQKSKEEK